LSAQDEGCTRSPHYKDPLYKDFNNKWLKLRSMPKNKPPHRGRHFLQIPGPSNVPERVLRAIDKATMDHRGPDFAVMALSVLDRIKPLFQTKSPVVFYPSSGTGAWEAALVNTLSPGDKVLMFETGQFATLWRDLAVNLGLDVDYIESDWRRGVDANVIESKLKEDSGQSIKAVCVVHNETSSGIASNVAAVRGAIDAAKHSALLMVDSISSLGSLDYRHDEWGIDVTIAGSQKGLMLPPGLGFNAISQKALDASKTSTLPKAYWRWDAMLKNNETGYFPYTPATNLLYGLGESLTMFEEEGLENTFARHARLAEATRRAVQAWGLEIVCVNPDEYSNVVTAVFTPEGHNADEFRGIVLDRFNMSLGNGLGKLMGKAFRIGHLGDFNELMLAGALSGVEMGLSAAEIPHKKGGISAALEFLAE
jgi:alanine-glyoxylate transaminase/serine-glyoxylate transaminase/serine-pyruvate transaminase